MGNACYLDNLTGHALDVIAHANFRSFSYTPADKATVLFVNSVLNYFPYLVSIFSFVVKMETTVKRNVEVIPIESVF